MKKLFFAVAMLMCTAGVMAQTVDEKAAAKAAKAELKVKQKAAEKQLGDALAINSEITTLSTENATEMTMSKPNQAKIDANNTKMVELSEKGLAPLREALASEYVANNKKFDAYVILESMASRVLNDQLKKYQNKQDMNLEAYANSVYGISDAYHGEITCGNAKDELQKTRIDMAKVNLPKSMTYYAYLCQFYILKEDLDGACKAYDGYRSFAARYPEVADNEAVKNPENPFSQFAFNIFYTAYKKKDLATMEKYHDEALTYEGENNQRLVTCAKAEILKEQNKMDEWVAEEKGLIAKDPKGDVGEMCMQQLMVYYNNQGKEQADAYTKELVEKYPDSKVANYCRGYALYSQDKLSEAVPFYNKAAEIDPTYGDAVYNSGYCLYQIATEKARAASGKTMKSQAAATKAANDVKGLYRQALPYFEKYSQMEADKSDRWGAPMYYIYSNLGMTAKAAEFKKYTQY